MKSWLIPIVVCAALAVWLFVVQRARRRRVQESLQASEARCRSVVNAQADLVCRFRPDSTLTFVNDAYCVFWNKPREALLGHRFFDWLPPETGESILSDISDLRDGTATRESSVVQPDGRVRWWEWLTRPILDETGELVEFQCVGRDVTQRKQAEEALARAEARTRAILRSMPDLMFVIRRDGTYLDYHARDPQLLFAPPAAFLGKTVREIMPPTLSGIFMDAIEHACTTGAATLVEYALPIGDELRHFEVRMVSAEPGGVLAIVRDTTKATRAHQLNRDLAGRLIASQEDERQRIARELHDDIGQRIALLNIGIDQLARGAAHAPDLRRLADHAAELATDVHALSHELHPSKLQAIGLVGAVAALCRDISHQSGLDVRFIEHPLPDLEASISLCLYRIAQEALHNVARHSSACGATVELAAQIDGVRLIVTDDGAGFDTGRTAMAGLGLVSMRERASFVGGRLMIQSAPGSGTRLEVQVPLAPIPSHSIARVQIA